MRDRVTRMTGSGGAEGDLASARVPAADRHRERRRHAPEAAPLTLKEALARLQAASHEANDSVQYATETVDEGVMVLVIRRQDATVIRRMPAAEAIRLATMLAGGIGGVFQGSF